MIVALLSHLPYISTLAGMNSLTSYEVLGPAGVLFLQAGMVVKSLFTLLLWAFCLFAFFVGQLPHWTGLQFRQANCFRSTGLVVWLVPIRPPADGAESSTFDLFLIWSYTFAWFLVLAIGSYWTLIAPCVLVKRGGHLRDPHAKKVKGFPLGVGKEPENLLHRIEGEDRAFAHHGDGRLQESDGDSDSDPANERGGRDWPGHAGGYKRDDDIVSALLECLRRASELTDHSEQGSLGLMTVRSLPKGASTASLPSYRSQMPPTPRDAGSSDDASSALTRSASSSGPEDARSGSTDDQKGSTRAGRASLSDSGRRAASPPPATRGMTALSPWSKGLRGSKQDAAARWTRRQIQSRHHFVIVRSRIALRRERDDPGADRCALF